jgi:hypothetical protein
MTVERIKRIIAATALLVLVVGSAAGLFLLGSVVARASRGADPASALTEVGDIAPGLDGVVEWMPDAPLQRRVVEPTTRRMIEAAWTRAWAALARAEAGDPSLVDAWFSGPALEQVDALVEARPSASELQFGTHALQITFYSDDGSVVGLRAERAETYRVLDTSSGPVVVTTTDVVSAVLVLEDGTWRIRQWVRGPSVDAGLTDA